MSTGEEAVEQSTEIIVLSQTIKRNLTGEIRGDT